MAAAQARACFGELLGWLSGPEAGGLDHAGLEEELDARGRELIRQLRQDHLDLRAAREERRKQAAGADGVVRTRAEKGHQRALATAFKLIEAAQARWRAVTGSSGRVV